ncbi:MAG: NAD-dependent epimerase [Xanthobacteraceae bacterium]|jgi:nucleoside-diphosphate-sugar epimerase|nr:NAD-dependent epimerase [Xanthobacteraceae bacterium]
MKILILGAAGMIGRKLLDRLALPHALGTPIDEVLLHDLVEPAPPAGLPFPTRSFSGDYAAPGVAERLLETRPEVIFHLASIVSGDAEARFEEGYRVNLDGSRMLFEAIRSLPDYRPRLVYTSSLAVFGPPYPAEIDDDFLCAPASSYGVQKAMVELLIADYSRKSFLDGVVIRLPTICVRPGRPNAALSSFFSGIIREPLNGLEAILPVEDKVRHWLASPRAAIGYLLHAATIDTASLGARRSLNMPGVSVTVGEQIEALRRFAGAGAAALIRRQPDPVISAIVGSWPQRFAPVRALGLGFAGDADFDAILRTYVDEELNGRVDLQRTA